MKVNVIGLGYIGLPTALMLASHDVKVIGTDCNEDAQCWQDHVQRKWTRRLVRSRPGKGHYVYNRL